MGAELNRRQFLRLGLGDLSSLMRQQRQPAGHSYLRPPGAQPDEETFLSACQRCHQCSAACPFDIIRHLGPAAGSAEGTPVLDPAETPCRWCSILDCVRACPSGALTLPQDGHARPIGKAEIDPARCLIGQGILCDECAAVCPSSIDALQMVARQPRVDPDTCVGCGLCAFFCQAEPAAVRITPVE